jgi:hypothetical protein
LVRAGQTWLAWIGDSRCYRCAMGRSSRWTRDHSIKPLNGSRWVCSQRRGGGEPPRRHELTRSWPGRTSVDRRRRRARAINPCSARRPARPGAGRKRSPRCRASARECAPLVERANAAADRTRSIV